MMKESMRAIEGIGDWAAVAFVIFAGFLFLTSRGDDGQVEKAKKTLIYAVIGIVIVMLSFAIVNTVIQVGQGQRPV